MEYAPLEKRPDQPATNKRTDAGRFVDGTFIPAAEPEYGSVFPYGPGMHVEPGIHQSEAVAGLWQTYFYDGPPNAAIMGHNPYYRPPASEEHLQTGSTAAPNAPTASSTISRAPAVQPSTVEEGFPLNKAQAEKVDNALAGAGQPLPEEQKAVYEAHTGHDFSRVRVHTGAAAEEAADSIGAKAFAKGSDIVFAKDQYNPGTAEGRGLIGHELAHVAQNATGVHRAPKDEKRKLDQPSGNVKSLIDKFHSSPGDVHEQVLSTPGVELAFLPLPLRSAMIESMLNRFWVDDVSERAIIALIESTPGRDALSLLNGMKKGAFAKLEQSVDGDNYYLYHLAIQRIYFSALQPEAAYLQMMKARKFPWSDPGFIAFATGTKKFLYDAMEITGQGKIRLQIYPQQAPLPFSMPLEYELDAIEMIQIEMFTGTEELGTKIGDHIYAPAITLFALKNTQSAREARFVLDFSLLAIGGAGLVAAKTIPAVVLAAVDIALGAGDMAVNEYRSVIAQNESGKRFLSTWDTVQFLLGVYGLARLLRESPRIFMDLRRLYREYRASKEVAKNPELIRELNQKLKGIVDDRELEQYLDEAGKKRPHADPAHPTDARKTPTLESHGDGKPHITYAERKFLKARAGAQSYILRLSESKNGILDLGKSLEGKRFLDIFHDMNDMFQVLNREIGLVRTGDGKFLMVLGELPSSEGKMYRYTLNKIQDMKDAEIIAHTHIKGASKLSEADYRFLLKRGQQSTFLIISEDSVVLHKNIRSIRKPSGEVDFDSDSEIIGKLKSLE